MSASGRKTNWDELLRVILPRLRVTKGPDPRGEYTCWCPFHNDGHGKPPHQPNLQVSVRGFYCHACGAYGGLRRLAERLGVERAPATAAEEQIYNYLDELGNLLYQIIRKPGKRFLCRRPDGRGGWIWNLKGVRRVLYHLPRLLKDTESTVYIAEGEKDTDRLICEGLLATTNSGGAGKWQREHSKALSGRDVVILADNDEPGQRDAARKARMLRGIARGIKIPTLPGLPDKGDVSDWLDAGHTVDELKAICAETPEWRSDADGQDAEAVDKIARKRESLAKAITDLALDTGIELFHDERGEAYAAIPASGDRRIMSLWAKDYTLWLNQLCWQRTGRTLGAEARSAARDTLAGIARYDRPQHPLHVRCAWHEGAIWYDLDGRRAVRVWASGWEIVERPPILFRCFPHQRPLVEPVRDGDAQALLRFVNISDDQVRTLLLCYLVAAMVPDIPVAALLVHGAQGSAKTTLLKVVKALLDPAVPAVRGGVQDLAEYAQAAWQNRVLFFDNLTHIADWLSDCLCRTVSGEGFSKRTLYTDEDTTVFEYRRVVGLSGINMVADKADVLDRSVIANLDPLSRSQRRDERRFWREFGEVAPIILGGLFDALARAMTLEPQLGLVSLPRMADFARWGAAAGEALGSGAGAFLAAYDGNVTRQNEAAVDASPVAQAVLTLMDGRREWNGTPAELLDTLTRVAEGLRIDVRARAWPKSPEWVSRRLMEVHPNLAAMGLTVILSHTDGHQRRVLIRRGDANAAPTVTEAETTSGTPQG